MYGCNNNYASTKKKKKNEKFEEENIVEVSEIAKTKLLSHPSINEEFINNASEKQIVNSIFGRSNFQKQPPRVSCKKRCS